MCDTPQITLFLRIGDLISPNLPSRRAQDIVGLVSTTPCLPVPSFRPYTVARVQDADQVAR
jgi:hypothetical protein